MKQYTHIMVTGSPEFIKRFNRWLKSRYNVNYPDFEKRYSKLNLVTVRWTVNFHDNWFFGNSEECLYAIARAAAEEHLRHTHNSKTGNWGVCSD